jgi:hypothetical protein
MAKAEAHDNEIEFNRQLGKFVRYGQIIQFKHIMTQCNLRISSTEAAKLDVLNMKVDFDAAYSKRISLSLSLSLSLSTHTHTHTHTCYSLT